MINCICRPGAGCVECKPTATWFSPEWPRMVTQRIIDELENHILDCKHAYYCLGKPLASDAMYDVYEDRLRKQRPNSWVLDAVGCPRCYEGG